MIKIVKCLDIKGLNTLQKDDIFLYSTGSMYLCKVLRSTEQGLYKTLKVKRVCINIKNFDNLSDILNNDAIKKTQHVSVRYLSIDYDLKYREVFLVTLNC